MLIKLHDACSTIYGFRFNLPAEIFIKRNSSYKTKIIKSILNSRNACFCWVKNLFVFLYSAWKNLRLNIRTLHLAVTLCGFRTRCLIPRKHLKLRCRKWQEAGENGITGGLHNLYDFTIFMVIKSTYNVRVSWQIRATLATGDLHIITGDLYVLRLRSCELR